MPRWIAPVFVCILATYNTQAAKLAIIVDDVGYNRQKGERLVNLPGPLTLAVLPYTPNAAALAARAHAAGKEVILHQPLESVARGKPARGTLTLDMGRVRIARQFGKAVASIPHVKGVNNHTGSRFTGDRRSMDALMQVVHERGLFWVDSRTTPETVAFPTALRWGVPFARRDIFLDHEVDRTFIARAFDRALALAERRGYAVVIAHPHRLTLEFLEEKLPSLAGTTMELVGVSELAFAAARSSSMRSMRSMRSTPERPATLGPPQRLASLRIWPTR